MLVLAPAACIMSGIALSEAFSVFTRSIKFQLLKPIETNSSGVCVCCLFLHYFYVLFYGSCFSFLLHGSFDMIMKAEDASSGSSTSENDTKKADKQVPTIKAEEGLRERPSKKNRKKEKETVEKVPKEREATEKVLAKSEREKRLLVLPLEASAVAILMLIILGAFYVVCQYIFNSLPVIFFF